MPATNHKNPLMTCPECGDAFELTDPRKVFCCPEHKRDWNNRMLGRGAPLVLLMQAWRQARHKKGDGTAKYAFGELCIAIDRASAEDKAAGRPPALEVLRNRYRRQGFGGIEAPPTKGKATRAIESAPNRGSAPAL